MSTPKGYNPPGRPLFFGQVGSNVSQERWDSIFKKEVKDGKERGEQDNDNMVQESESN